MTEKTLSIDEAELYDRQIRLWGIESQEKLRAANVLLINVRGLGSEIAKNVVLSGINSITFLDDAVVTEEEIIKNFLLTQDSLGKNIAEAVLLKAQALNPLVKITADTESLSKKDEKYYGQFSIVVATALTSAQILEISGICREHKVKFIYGDNFGMFGFTVADFQEHQYYEDKVKFVSGSKRTHDGKIVKDKKAEKTIEKVAANLSYPEVAKIIDYANNLQHAKRRNVYYYLMLALLEFRTKHARNPLAASKDADISELKAIKQKILKDFKVNEEKLPDDVLNLIFGEIVPVCSVIGGVLSQEVIKAVSGKEVPIRNVFLFDPLTYSGREEVIGC